MILFLSFFTKNSENTQGVKFFFQIQMPPFFVSKLLTKYTLYI